MKKINNFKIYFSNILKEKYCMNKEGIDNYFIYKENQENFNNKKIAGVIIGLSELSLAASLSVVDYLTKVDCAIPVLILGGVGVLTTKISLSIENPYNLKKYKEIDKTYEMEKKKYKVLRK